jgi:uncharacterized protein (DUF1800 family)
MFDRETAAIRFGTGLSPRIAPRENVAAMLAGLQGPDDMAARFPVDRFDDLQMTFHELRQLNIVRRKNRDTPVAKEAKQRIKLIRRQARKWQGEWLKAAMLRGMMTEQGLRERLVHFWADHFTVIGKKPVLRNVAATYVEEAIRPNIAGNFADLLMATTFHPMMLFFLDQVNSAGTNSRAAVKRPGRGLNENLAREVLELHTLGVDGAYNQKDVRALAELFAGLSYRQDEGFVFATWLAEPGPKTVLGKTYGKGARRLEHIREFLRDLAVHPDTARHLARKLAVHFVSDTPDAGLVDAIARAWRDSGGELMAAYRALLEHPAARALPDRNIKQPLMFMISALRALDVDEKTMRKVNHKTLRAAIYAPLGLMGQPWERPNGPDGWTEDDAEWITPQALAARIQWAMTVPGLLRRDLPDPREFVQAALGARAGGALEFATGAATTRAEGIGIVLASPQFQRQ